MEYALWDARACSLSSNGPNVLILVLMEYALWGGHSFMYRIEFKVLILVLMEYALWAKTLE